MTNSRLLKFWLPVSENVNCESLTVVIFPETEEGSGKLLRGASSAGMGTDHKEIAKHNRKNVAIETAVRKRMMEYTSNIMSFDWVGKEGHEGCQRGREFSATGTQEKKRDRGRFGDLADRYRYANCSLGLSCGRQQRVWDSRVRAQDFLTGDARQVTRAAVSNIGSVAGNAGRGPLARGFAEENLAGRNVC